MSKPTEHLDEIAQWKIASAILDQFGDCVGDYLLEQIRAALADYDRDGADQWMLVAAKIQLIIRAEDAGTLQ